MHAGQNRLLALNYIHQGEERLVCAAHEEWGAAFQRQFRPLPPLPPPRRAGSAATHGHPAAAQAAANGDAHAATAAGSDMPHSGASRMDALAGGGAANHSHTNGVDGGGGDVASSAGSDSEDEVVSDEPLVVGYLSPDLFTVCSLLS